MFSDHAIQVLNQYIRECEKRSDLEFEVRFSLIGKQDPNREGHGHVNENSLLEEAIRGRIYRYLSSIPNVRMQEFHTKESIYPEDKSGSLRRVESTINGRRYEHYMLKRPVKKWDDWNYNMRFSLASECKLINPFINRGAVLRRDKNRVSFTDPARPFVRYDLTRVTTFGRKGELPVVSYEFEVEWVKAQQGTANDMTRILHEVLQVIQASSFVMSSRDISDTRYQYFQMAHKRHFIGAQPESLQVSHLDSLVKQRYSVTVKMDGERALVYIRKDGRIILIDRLMLFRDTGLSCPDFADTLLDAELADNQVCHIFDILYLCGNDLRGKASMDLPSRMQEVTKVVGAMGSARFVAKEYLWDTTDIPSVIKKAQKRGADGLIFTPVDKAYPLKNMCDIYKWKPVETNSVDFYISKERPDPTQPQQFLLYVTNSDGTLEIFKDARFGFMESSLPANFTGGIVECTLENGSFKAHRLRLDKIRPNHVRVVHNVIETMVNPVTTDMLLQVAEQRSQYGQTKVSDFGVLRAYHNQVKSKLIKDAFSLDDTKESYRVLDLACGRGGDMFKWDRPNVSLYVGVDINNDFLSEAQQRATKLVHIKPHFYQCDLEKQSFHLMDVHSDKSKTEIPSEIDWSLLDEDFEQPHVEPHEAFDIVSLQFCIHYFFKDQQTFDTLFKTIDCSLGTGGLVLITTLDGNEVYNNTEYYNDADTTRVHSTDPIDITDNIIMHPMDLAKTNRNQARDKQFGTAFQIEFTGDPDMILTQYDKPEFVVFPEVLIDIMSRRGYSLVKSSRFLSNDPTSCVYSNMNRTYIFEKRLYSDMKQDNMVKSSDPWESTLGYLSEHIKVDPNINKGIREYCIEKIQKNTKYGLRQLSINGDKTHILVDRTPWLLVDAFGDIIKNNDEYFHTM